MLRATSKSAAAVLSSALTSDLRDYQPADWPEVERIYRAGLAGGLASFELEPRSAAAFAEQTVAGSFLVSEAEPEQGERRLAGWAVLWRVSSRPCYQGVAEVSLYIDPACQGAGRGGRLLAALVQRSEALGLWTLQAAILAENMRSTALHMRAGFRLVGRRERIAERLGRWHDILLLERRSRQVEVDR